MPRPHNLISDSSLLQETHQLAHESGGRAAFVQIAASVMQLANIPTELAAGLVCDLVDNDPRFRVEGDYLALNDDPIENQPVHEIDFVVVDVEAIAGRGAPTRAIEIGACRVRGGEITGDYETLLNPALPIPRFIAALTGITEVMLQTAPQFAEVVEAWLSFAADAVLVAHNSNFDFTLLNQEINRVFPGSRMRNQELCTVQLARRVLPNLENHNLDALAEHFGFEIKQRHRAAGDARATARILLGLLDELEIRGVRTLAEIRKFQPAGATPATEVQLALDS